MVVNERRLSLLSSSSSIPFTHTVSLNSVSEQELVALHNRFAAQGLEIIAFPSDEVHRAGYCWLGIWLISEYLMSDDAVDFSR